MHTPLRSPESSFTTLGEYSFETGESASICVVNRAHFLPVQADRHTIYWAPAGELFATQEACGRGGGKSAARRVTVIRRDLTSRFGTPASTAISLSAIGQLQHFRRRTVNARDGVGQRAEGSGQRKSIPTPTAIAERSAVVVIAGRARQGMSYGSRIPCAAAGAPLPLRRGANTSARAATRTR